MLFLNQASGNTYIFSHRKKRRADFAHVQTIFPPVVAIYEVQINILLDANFIMRKYVNKVQK
jgi:hypothetical protein